MASSRSLGSLTVNVAADIGQFERGMNQAERAADKLDRQLKKSERTTKLFDAQHEAAKQLVAASEYIDFWTNALSEMEAAEKSVKASLMFEEEHQKAKRLAQDSEYVRFWTNALQQKEAASAASKESALFEEEHQKAVRLSRDAEYIQFWNKALDKKEAIERNTADSMLFEKEHQAAKRLVQDAEYVRFWSAEIDKMEAAEKRATTNRQFINSLRQQSDAIGKTRADLLSMQAAEMGLSSQAAPYIAKLRQQETALQRTGRAFNAYGKSAGETSMALRQVPAQITDIIVSLQGGQAPLTVLLQQGGQLRDLFGGIGPAARALGSGLLKLVTPLTALGAALAAIGFGYFSGSKEADEYAKNIINTGNAAGTTVGQLQTYAANIDNVAGTQAKAAEVLADLAGSGFIANESLEEVAKTAILLERSLGKPIKDTVKEFESLGKEPVEASRKLNEQYRYLTASTYEQIRALKDAGREAEAAALAQSSFLTEQQSRAKQAEERLGYLERGWRGVKDAIAEAADALRRFGREETTDDTVARMAQMRQNAAALRNRPLAGNIPPQTLHAGQVDEERSAQRRQGAEVRLADWQARNAKNQQAAIVAAEEISKIREASLTNEQRMNAELSKYRKNLDATRLANPGSALLNPGQIAKDEASIRERYRRNGRKPRADDPTKQLLENDLKDLELTINAERDLMASRNKFLDLYNSEGLISIKDYYSAQKAILDEATTGQISAYDKQIEALKKYQASLPKGKDTERADAQGKINDLLDKQAKLQQQAGLSAIEMELKREKATREYQDALTDLDAQVRELEGSLGEVAGIRFDKSTESLRKLLEANNNTAGLQTVKRLREAAVAQADLNKLQQQFALGQGDLQIAEERIALARQAGTMTETQSLLALGEARTRQYAALQEQIRGFENLKAAMALTPEQMQQYERLKVQLEQLGATLDPLADRINTMFDDSLGNLFTDLATGAKSAKDAVKDFFNTFAKELLGLSAKDLASQFRQALFPTGGGIGQWFSESMRGSAGSNPFASFGGFVSNLLGGGQQQAPASGAAGLGLATSSTAASASLASMTAAATAAAAALGSIAGSAGTAAAASSVGSSGNWLSAVGNWFTNFGFASGGYTGNGGMFQPAGIVHRGEYVLDAATTRRLGVPALDQLQAGGAMGGSPVFHINVLPGATRETGYQAARATYAELQRARR